MQNFDNLWIIMQTTPTVSLDYMQHFTHADFNDWNWQAGWQDQNKYAK